ncbi:cupin-like domain-containing protein [Runella sp.]|uniref:cupin-like domain-containing protein n=1 Tax=Runella sp. TaxID=1960881 RepID=UPI003D0BE984
MDLTLKIDILDSTGLKDFNDNYFLPQKPVVIKGLTDNEIAGKKWTINYFKETMGDLEIGVYDNSNKQSASSAHTLPDLKMKFGDYLTIIENNERTDLRIFLFNFFKSNPNLRNEFPCPHIFEGVLDNMGYMFFGGKDTTVRIHYDIDMSNVLLTHFGGQKRVVLIAPEYNDLLYRLPFNTYSLIDIDKIDSDKYPGLKYIKGYDHILEHGDSIFMPSGYWHYMTYLERSFSISYRKIAPTIKTKMQGVINIGVLMPFDKLMGKIWGKKWLTLKEEIAERKAKKAIDDL